MNIRLDDRTLFGNDAGEDEDREVLVSYFVDQPAFADFLDPGVRLQVAKGRKGTGKSALLVRFAHTLANLPEPPIVLHLVPSSLAALKEPPATDNAVVLENYWKQVACGAINMELARSIGFAWNDDRIALVESAELAGFKGRNIVSALLSRLVGRISIPGVVDLTPTPRPAVNPEQLLQRLAGDEGSPRRVWLLLDDIDSTFQNTPHQQAYVASFFSACRYLVREIAGIGIRATVRADVWSSLRAAEDLDKFEQYLTDIRWSAAQQKTILAKRILAYLQRQTPEGAPVPASTPERDADALIEQVFDRRMRWAGKVAPPTQVLGALAAGRPRWMTQLCRLAGQHAARTGAERIGLQHIHHVMGDFGRRRLDDLYKEHHHQFADLKRLVESFSGGARGYTTAEFVQRIEAQYVARTPAIPAVDGTPYRNATQLAHLLFKCGFVSGHNPQPSLDVPEFIGYELRPDLLQVETNLDDGMAWDVLPAYRNVLHLK